VWNSFKGIKYPKYSSIRERKSNSHQTLQSLANFYSRTEQKQTNKQTNKQTKKKNPKDFIPSPADFSGATFGVELVKTQGSGLRMGSRLTRQPILQDHCQSLAPAVLHMSLSPFFEFGQVSVFLTRLREKTIKESQEAVFAQPHGGDFQSDSRTVNRSGTGGDQQ
jgi:hypothetical protein